MKMMKMGPHPHPRGVGMGWERGCTVGTSWGRAAGYLLAGLGVFIGGGGLVLLVFLLLLLLLICSNLLVERVDVRLVMSHTVIGAEFVVVFALLVDSTAVKDGLVHGGIF